MARSKATDDLAQVIVAAVDTPGTIGVALVGSHARGTATRWSDFDVHRYVPDDSAKPSNIVQWLGDRLLRANTVTPSEVREELTRPETAVWAVEPTRTMRILVDRGGQLAAIRSESLAFEWSRVAEAANDWASKRLSKDAENVLKLRGDIFARAIATCALYQATVSLLAVRLDAQTQDVVARAIAVMPR